MIVKSKKFLSQTRTVPPLSGLAKNDGIGKGRNLRESLYYITRLPGK